MVLMFMNNHLSFILSFVSYEDFKSLDSIKEIKNNEVIDIYDNGTTSTPYETGGWDYQGLVTSTWRTIRWITGYGSNRGDIPKLKSLMERTVLAYRSGCEPLKIYLTDSLPGLENLKCHYEKQNPFFHVLNSIQLASSSSGG